MKLKTRLVIAFFTIIIIPVLMAAMMVSMVCRYQIGVVEKNYGITGTTISDFTNSMQVLARVTEKPYHELKDMSEQASEMEDATELDQFNKKLENKNAYLLVRKDGTIVYTGSDDDRVKAVIEQLPGYGDTDTTSENGIYLGGDAEGKCVHCVRCIQCNSGGWTVFLRNPDWNCSDTDTYFGSSYYMDLPCGYGADRQDADSGAEYQGWESGF